MKEYRASKFWLFSGLFLASFFVLASCLLQTGLDGLIFLLLVLFELIYYFIFRAVVDENGIKIRNVFGTTYIAWADIKHFKELRGENLQWYELKSTGGKRAVFSSLDGGGELLYDIFYFIPRDKRYELDTARIRKWLKRNRNHRVMEYKISWNRLFAEQLHSAERLDIYCVRQASQDAATARRILLETDSGKLFHIESDTQNLTKDVDVIEGLFIREGWSDLELVRPEYSEKISYTEEGDLCHYVTLSKENGLTIQFVSLPVTLWDGHFDVSVFAQIDFAIILKDRSTTVYVMKQHFTNEFVVTQDKQVFENLVLEPIKASPHRNLEIENLGKIRRGAL